MNPPRGEQGEAWGNFRYSCLGYSVFRATSGHKDGGVHLPSCEFGVEVRLPAFTAGSQTPSSQTASPLTTALASCPQVLASSTGKDEKQQAPAATAAREAVEKKPERGTARGGREALSLRVLKLLAPALTTHSSPLSQPPAEALPPQWQRGPSPPPKRAPSPSALPISVSDDFPQRCAAHPTHRIRPGNCSPGGRRAPRRWLNVSKKMLVKMGKNLEYSRKAVATAISGKWNDSGRGGGGGARRQ